MFWLWAMQERLLWEKKDGGKVIPPLRPDDCARPRNEKSFSPGVNFSRRRDSHGVKYMRDDTMITRRLVSLVEWLQDCGAKCSKPRKPALSQRKRQSWVEEKNTVVCVTRLLGFVSFRKSVLMKRRNNARNEEHFYSVGEYKLRQ